MSLFDHNYYTHPEYYKLQQGKLMEYIILKFKESWDNYFGSRDLDYPIAYAEWARFSHEHAKSYKNHRFWTDEPDLAVSPQSQAVDHKIFTDIAFNIQPTIEKTGKNPFYIIVSGDGGYGQALLELRRLGCQYQFWYFRSQNVRPFIKNLDDKQKIWLEDVLLLDQFSL